MQSDFWHYISTTNKPVWLYGMGDGADKIINALALYNKEIYGVFASDEFVRGQSFHSYKVHTFNEAVSECKDIIVLVCFGSGIKSVIDNVKKISATQEVYAPDVPVYGGGLFNSDFARKNEDKLRQVYNILADEHSKKVFENTVMYKLSAKLDYLFSCQSEVDEAYSLLNLSDEEIFVDLGAYRGDTVSEFINHTSGYNKIYAVEPDRKTFKKLEQNTKDLNNIFLYNVCISDKKGLIPFSMKSGRNSSAGAGELLNAESVDSILATQKASYIKFDVEGSELLAIKGAYNTIKNFKPKMNIACYHRNEDIFSIPLEVLKIRSDYKVYLRHYPCIPSWDTQFYFI